MSEKIHASKVIVDKEVAFMRKAAQEKFKEMQQLMSKESLSLLRSRFALGEHVHELASQQDKYGKKSIPTIAFALGCGRDLLDDARRLHEVWPKKADQEKLIALRDKPRGLPLGLQQAVEIAKLTIKAVDDTTQTKAQARKEWVRRWQDESLSVKDLRAAKTLPAATAARGDAPTGPAATKSFVRALKSNAIAAENCMKVSEERFKELIDDDADACTPDVLSALEEALDALKQQRKAVTDQVKQTEKRIERVKDGIQFDSPKKSDVSDKVSAGRKAVAV